MTLKQKGKSERGKTNKRGRGMKGDKRERATIIKFLEIVYMEHAITLPNEYTPKRNKTKY